MTAPTPYCSFCWTHIVYQKLEPLFLDWDRDLPSFSLWPWDREHAYWVRPLVHHLKRRPLLKGWEILAQLLSEQAVYAGLECPRGFLIPPRSPHHLKDHAWRLGTEMSKAWGVPLFDIFEPINLPPQKSLKKQARLRRKLKVNQTLRLKHGLVLIDDLITTGGTARAVQSALGHPEAFSTWTLFRRPRLAKPLGF